MLIPKVNISQFSNSFWSKNCVAFDTRRGMNFNLKGLNGEALRKACILTHNVAKFLEPYDLGIVITVRKMLLLVLHWAPGQHHKGTLLFCISVNTEHSKSQ